jgi:hypothetical protein
MSPDQRRYEFEDEPPDPGRLTADNGRLPWPSPEWSEEAAAPVRWPSALDDDLRRELLDAFDNEPAETAPSRTTLASRLRLPARAVIALVVVAGAATAIALGSAGGGSPEPKQTGGATTTGQVTTTARPANGRADEGQSAREEVSDQGDRSASSRRPASELSGARPRENDGASTARPRTSPAAQPPTPLPADRPSVEFEPGPWSDQ